MRHYPIDHRTPSARAIATTWWLLALLGALLALPRSGAAQTYTTPRIRIAPDGGSYSAGDTVRATVQYCSRYPFHTGSEALTLNGAAVPLAGTTTTTGTQPDCPLNHVQFERQNIVLALGHGINAFKASIENNPDGLPNNPNGFYRQVVVSYETPWPHVGVSVVADNRYVNARAGTTRQERYTITNTGDASTAFTASCSWSPGTGCALSANPGALAPGASHTFTATVAVGAVGDSGRLAFDVSGGIGPLPASASAITTITAVAPPATARGVTIVNPGGTVARDLCVTIKAGNDAAMECGDLRLAHALPSIRTKGKARTPVLLYNSALAEPRVRIAADVALDSGFVTQAPFTDNIWATVILTSPASVAGQSYPAGQWKATHWPANGEAQRIVASFDASHLPTGKYGYQLVIRRTSDEIEDVATGTLLHVNRSRSPYHGGWWVAGLEQLVAPEGGGLLWVGGDGSAHLYKAGKFGCPYSVVEPIGERDQIACNGNGWHTRQLANGLRIVFDSAGRHRYTVNRHADTTEFAYNAQGALASIIVPPRTGGVGVASYTFHYGASGLLDSVSAPPLNASVPRRLKVTWTTGRPMLGGVAGGRILSLTDPDTTAVQLHYFNETAGQGHYRPTSRVDRRLTTTTFTYGPGDKLATASTPASASQTVTQAFRPAESVGIDTAASLDSVYTRLDGPRSDVADVTKWWVNRLGAPLRVRDPMGVETTVTYDAMWVGLASITRGPTGMESRAFYNSRALVDSVKAINPLGTGQEAVTRYRWNATWDMPDTVRAPTGEITVRSYDADGNVLWEQPGTNAARRVTFAYDPATKQLTSARYPGIATPDTIEYDAVLRNVSKTTSPAGRWTRSYADALGRDTLVESPIDTTGRKTVQRIAYDLADQVIASRTEGPAMPYTLPDTDGKLDTATVLSETLIELTTYDQEGNVTRLQKLATPNPRPWANLCGTGDGPNTQCSTLTAADTGSVDVRTYDGLHRLLTQRLGSTGGRYQYDLAGNPTQWLSWANGTTTMQYDAANRRVRTVVGARPYAQELCQNVAPGPLHAAPYCFRRFPIYPNNASSGLTIPADTSRFVFDQAGLLRGAYNRYARVDRSYLPSGAMATDTLRLRDYAGAGFTLTYGLRPEYDLSGRRTALRTPTAADSIRYTYDAELGVLTTVRQGTARIRFTYDLAGRQDSLLIGTATVTGVREQRAYDADGMLVRRERVSAALGTLVKDSILHDLRDKALDVSTQSLAADVGTMEYRTRYSGLGAVLAQQKRKTALPNAWELEEFRTTALGDVYRSRTFRNGGDNVARYPLVATMNPFGALIAKQPLRDTINDPYATQYDDTTYAQSDGAGNVVWTGTLFRGILDGDPYTQAHTRSWFGADNKLRFQQRYTSAGTVQGSTGVAKGSWEEHWYDALGRKVLTRARRDSLCTPTTGDGCHSYIERTVWDGDQVLYELRGLGGDDASTYQLDTDVSSASLQHGKVGYIHAGGIDAPLVLMDGRVPTYNWRGLAESSVWLDGTAADCTVSGGGTCTRIDWPGNQGVYMKVSVGQSTTQTGTPTWVGSLLANGVGSTGMAYRRNRFYDGATGQFNQQDPIGLAGGANAYGFAGGDPVSYSDPYGLMACPPLCGPSQAQLAIEVRFQEDLTLRDRVALGTIALGAAGLGGGVAAGTARAVHAANPVANAVLPVVAGAVPKLMDLAQKFQTTASDIVNKAMANGQRLLDTKSGNINTVIPRLDGVAGWIRVTLDPTGSRVVSAGLQTLNQVKNGITNGRFIPQ